MNTVLCPKCGTEVEITHALRHQIEAEIKKDEEEKHKIELEKVKLQAQSDAVKKIKEEQELILKNLQEEAREEKEKRQKMTDEMSQLIKEKRELQAKDELRELEMQKKLAEEEIKIKHDAQKKAEEEQHTKIAELEKAKADALKEIEDMRRKLQQGSQQAQGETFELEFEQMLRTEFPNDKISPVAKGTRGGDIIHEVWDSKGSYNGKILWELKNTKLWSEGWVDKLKSDKRAINAEEAVIISDVLPEKIQTAGYRNGVWVTKKIFVIALASTLRAKLIEMYYVKQSVQAKDGKMETMYSYLSGTEFKHRVEAIVEAFSNMQSEIEKEKRYFMTKWARDEKNIRMVIDNTYGMHGDLKAIVGKVLPQIKGIDSESDDANPRLALDATNEA
ncbi:MAG: DUF2130 domain-containing protein [Candidatus Levybacteria bacterium]|nr:DUF2130 domain-containing protein [Candidatus Levybacteria bacterium]